MMNSKHAQFTPPGPTVEARVTRLLQRLTLDEKIFLLSGEHKGTRGVPAKGIPAFRFADGPMGVHWWCERSTAYPATVALASAWDRHLAYRMGAAVGRDARGRGVHVLLGPGVNLYRAPLCGRNFEYMGEDPELTASLASALVCGVQDQGVAATVKHYAVNYQEYDRHQISSDVDARTLRECYLLAFERVVREAGVGAVMTAYNLVNGRHCSEHDELINGVLKGEWGFDGLVMSDWASTYSAVGATQAGLDMEMPTGLHLNAEKLKPALAAGTITEEMINDKVRRLLRLAVCFGWLDREQQDKTIPECDPVTMAVALEVARKGIVLLKNDGAMLPLEASRVKKLVVLGGQAEQPAISGGGSGYTPPSRMISLLDSLRELAGTVTGPSAWSYPSFGDSGGRDGIGPSAGLCRPGPDPRQRTAPQRMRPLPVRSNELQMCPPATEILLGITNPSGKLPLTMERRWEDRSSFSCYHDEDGDGRVQLTDGIFGGYRHVDRTGVAPRFAFGHGLGYSTFAYGKLRRAAARGRDGDKVKVELEIRNTGSRAGEEVVQLYVGQPKSRLPRPVRELKDFVRVALKPGQKKVVTFTLTPRHFRYYDPDCGSWVVEPGSYILEAGASASDLRSRMSMPVGA